MVKNTKPRAGSLQFWPRKRARKALPSVNWKALKSASPGFLGFIAYKVGMISCIVKDSTPDSLTKGKKIVLPATILELPPMKIFSVRFYKNNKVVKDVLVSDDKELKRKVRLPKTKKGSIDDVKDYDDIKVIVYSKVKETGIKKTPDLTEIALAGSLDEKINFVKEKLNKEISAGEIFSKTSLIDVRGLTKGKGFVGPVKRFGIKLRQHKSEKGRRRPGSIAPWHPARVTFRTPMAGQLGLFTRVCYNSKILNSGKISEKDINPEYGWKNYGKIKTEYLILQGSVPGTEKRQLLLTMPLRAGKSAVKKNYEFVRML